jgi:hypothetical protein
VLRRRAPKRLHLNNTDRFLFDWLYRWFPSVLGAIAIVRPETIIRWHRAGFRAYWRWRSRNHVGRPKVSAELRTLIGEMSQANPLWGAPHIHGELLKLGFEVAQSTVARYMCLEPHALWLLDLIGARPDITLEEIRTLLRERGISVSVATVWNFYARHGISFKKKAFTPPSRLVPTWPWPARLGRLAKGCLIPPAWSSSTRPAPQPIWLVCAGVVAAANA